MSFSSIVRVSVLGVLGLTLLACGGGSDEDPAGGSNSPAVSGAGSSGSGGSGGGGGSGASGTGPGVVVPKGSCVIKTDVTKSTTWSPGSCPDGYLVKYETRVRGAGVELKIEPGTVIKHDGGMLTVEDGAAIMADGTAQAKVRFTSLQGAPGGYRGLRITSNNIGNRLVHTVIEHAGSSDLTYSALAVSVDGSTSGQVALSDVEIIDNARGGLGLFGNAKLPVFERVTLARNAEGAARVEAPLVPLLKGEGHHFEGVVLIDTSPTLDIVEDAEWPNPAPAIYRIVNQGGSGYDMEVKSHLVIEAGTTIEVGSNAGIVVGGGAAGLKAVGTADKKITFTGVSGAGWAGITFGETTWLENRLEHVSISNALKAPSWGYYGTGNSAVRKAGILLGYNNDTAVKLTVKNISISGPNNAPADIAVKDGTSLVQQGTNAGTAAKGALNLELF